MYSKEIKDLAIIKLKEGLTIDQISKELNISKATIYNWKKSIKIEELEEEVKIVCLDEMHNQINQLVDEGKFEEALKLTEELNRKLQSNDNNKFTQNAKANNNIQNDNSEHMKELSKRIANMIEINDLKEALELCEREEVLNNLPIQSQRITILIKLNRLEAALELCEKGNFCTHPFFNTKKESLINQIKAKDKNLVVQNNEVNMKNTDEKSYVLTRIYCNDITLHEIESAKINEFENIILTIAYYDKNNKKNGIKFIKEKKKLYVNDKKKLKILNILLERLLNKKNIIFDYNIYGKYLNCYVDFDLATEITNKQKTEQPVETIPTFNKSEEVKLQKQEQSIPRKEIIPSPKIITSQGKRVTSRHSVNSSNIEKQTSVKKQELLMKDLFGEELVEIGRHIYARMGDLWLQKKAIEAWDRLENLANQPVSDKEKLQKMISLIQRLENVDGMKISVDEKRYSKYL